MKILASAYPDLPILAQALGQGRVFFLVDAANVPFVAVRTFSGDWLVYDGPSLTSPLVATVQADFPEAVQIVGHLAIS